jgi:hypothetical protein
MWFSREQFALAAEAKQWGLTPRFEPGDIVARGFADLGYEEFQVLPSEKILSLTAGSVSALPSEHASHFFWIPSVDELTELLERQGVSCVACSRVEQREWLVEAHYADELEAHRHESLHQALLATLCGVLRKAYKKG